MLSDVLIGVLIGVACGIKIYALLIGITRVAAARRHEWMRTAPDRGRSLVTLALGYSSMGLKH